MADGEPGLFGDLGVGGGASEPLDQSVLGGLHLGDGVHHVDRDPDGPCLVGDRPGDRLADPPGGVGGELEALAIFELLDCPDQTQVALLDQVEERHPRVGVALGDAHHQTEVGLDEAAPGSLAGVTNFHELVAALVVGFALESGLRSAAPFDRLGQHDLFVCGQEVVAADPVQVLTDRLFARITVDVLHSARSAYGITARNP